MTTPAIATDNPTLYLLMGLPGSGKTTTAKQISTITSAVHLSSDDYRLNLFNQPQFTQDEHESLYKILDYMCEVLLKNGISVVYDANLNRYIHRDEKYRLAKKLGVKTVLVHLSVHKQLAKERRLATQHHGLVPKHETPHDMFERIAGVLEIPGNDEPHIELDGTKITKAYVVEQLNLQILRPDK